MSNRVYQQVDIPHAKPSPGVATDIEHVKQSTSFSKIQKTVIEQDSNKSSLRSLPLLRLRSREDSVTKLLDTTCPQVPSTNRTKSLRFETSNPMITLTASHGKENAHDHNNISKSYPVDGFCFLSERGPPSGLIRDGINGYLELCKSLVTRTERVRLLSFPELIKAYQQETINIPRQCRYEIAAHIASALLQAHLSPWISTRLVKKRLLPLVDTDADCLAVTTRL